MLNLFVKFYSSAVILSLIGDSIVNWKEALASSSLKIKINYT